MILVGLGNPGEEYENTRHNAGFLFVDYLAQKSTSEVLWKRDTKTMFMYANTLLSDHKVSLVKPLTFMNRSGESVAEYIRKYASIPHPLESLYVAHDDLDLPLGTYKISKGKGPKLHNGLLSTEESLKTADFHRIRIGVDKRSKEKPIAGIEYVLSNFENDETLLLIDSFSKITASLPNLL